MKPVSEFERSSLEQGQVPLATSRLAKQWLGKTQEASCHR